MSRGAGGGQHNTRGVSEMQKAKASLYKPPVGGRKSEGVEINQEGNLPLSWRGIIKSPSNEL